tara:strand:- start:503 stop:682 length:180 start_codon:yes stop_codon:yes gene_type:complete
MKKTVKVPFEIILRNKKTKEEMKVGNINIPVTINVNKEQLHQIMKDNLDKDSEDAESNE